MLRSMVWPCFSAADVDISAGVFDDEVCRLAIVLAVDQLKNQTRATKYDQTLLLVLQSRANLATTGEKILFIRPALPSIRGDGPIPKNEVCYDRLARAEVNCIAGRFGPFFHDAFE